MLTKVIHFEGLKLKGSTLPVFFNVFLQTPHFSEHMHLQFEVFFFLTLIHLLNNEMYEKY